MIEQLAFDMQAVHLERVTARIGAAVLDFFNERLGRTFFAAELCNYVWRECGPCAPDSPGRVMRQLRLDGRIDYEVIDRSRALYRVTRASWRQP